MRAIVFFWGLALQSGWLCGCSCDDEDESKKAQESVDLSKPPPPLVVQEVPDGVGARVFPQKGATDPRPIALVLAQGDSVCAAVRAEWKSSGHVICTEATAEAAGPRLRSAVSYLKQTYPRHVGKPPVHLFADRERSEAGWRLMLQEPGFFSYAYLPGLEEKVLTHTTLSALHSRGARELFLGLEESNRLKLLKTVAARRGLQIHPLGEKASALKEVAAQMKSRDARLAAPAPGRKAP